MAVYTDVSDEELEAFIGSYAIGALTSFKGIAEGVENSNYLVHTEGGRYILTLYEKRVRREDLPYFLGLMQHLSARRISCPLPVKDRSGSTLKELAGRPAALITFLEGLWVRRPNIEHCQGLGEALAHFHLAGTDFPMFRANSLSLPGWRALFDTIGVAADEVVPGLAAMIEMELCHLDKNWPTELPEGVIHADLFPDNVFFLNDKVSGLIDFYFACNDMLAYDVAVCVNAWCFESDGSYNVTKARSLIGAYQKARALSAEERKALPILLRGGALRFLLTRLHDWIFRADGALVTPHNPLEYYRKLRFHQGEKRLGELGIAS